MLFAIYKRRADLCGNEESNLVGYYEAPTKIDAEAAFPRGFLVGFEVEEIKPMSKTDIKRRAEKYR